LSGVCVQCPQNSTFSNETGICILQLNNTNPNPLPTCPIGAVFDDALQKCLCPFTKPFDDGYVCRACTSPSYWNQTSRTCSSCSDGTVYNSVTNNCQPCPSNTPL